MRTVSRFPKNAKTEAVPIEGIADRLVSDRPDQTAILATFPYWRNPKSKVGFAAAPARQNDSGYQPSLTTASRAEFAASSPLTNNRSSCRNCTPYRYSSGNSCRSSYMRVGLPQTQSRKSPPQEPKREFWYSFSYGLSLLMQPRLAPAKR